MSTRSSALAYILLGSGLLAGAAAAADDAPTTFAITPFIGYRVGGGFDVVETGQHVSLDDHTSWALALDVAADENSQYEFFYSQQSTAIGGGGVPSTNAQVEYLHLGGTIILDDSHPRVRPYLAGGLGATRLSSDAPGAHEDTSFSLSLALGLGMPVNRHFMLRLEGRGYLSLMGTESVAFCRSEGGATCQIRAAGSTLFQFEFLAGGSFAF